MDKLKSEVLKLTTKTELLASVEKEVETLRAEQVEITALQERIVELEKVIAEKENEKVQEAEKVKLVEKGSDGGETEEELKKVRVKYSLCYMFFWVNFF